MYNLIISIILSLLLGALAFYKKAMTNSALILAIVLAFLITYFGGLCAYLILVAVFLGTVVANKIKKSERIKVNKNIIEKSGKKDRQTTPCAGLKRPQKRRPLPYCNRQMAEIYAGRADRTDSG